MIVVGQRSRSGAAILQLSPVGVWFVRMGEDKIDRTKVIPAKILWCCGYFCPRGTATTSKLPVRAPLLCYIIALRSQEKSAATVHYAITTVEAPGEMYRTP